MAAFAAAEAIRWIEIGVNSLAFSLVGLTLVLYGVALAAERRLSPLDWLAGRGRWSCAPHPWRGSELPRLCPLDCRADRGLALLALWTVVMAVLMWRRSNLRPVLGQELVHPESA